MKKRKQVSKKGFVIRWASVVGGVAIVTTGLNIAAFGQFSTVLDGYFRPSLERSDAVTQGASDLTEEIQSEGMVLLKNNGVLPLAEDSRRVNVFGWSSTNPVYGGTGSGAVDAEHALDLFAGLEAAGIEYNGEIADFYRDYRGDRPAIQIRAQNWTIPEPTLEEYDAAGIFESAQEYSDTAIVMVSRSGGEGADLARTLAGGDIAEQELPDGRIVPVGANGSDYEDDLDGEKHYLELSNRETAMLDRVTADFENVVVLVNTGNTLEMGFIDELDVDAAAWIGGPGETGFLAVGQMLTGEVNPSGRTVDTWLYDLWDNPTQGNYGRFHYTDSENVDTGDVPIEFSGDPSTAPGFQFLNYSEGIYVGYRYFETLLMNDEAAYQETVQFPFGYGLSYTDFDQEMGALSVSGEVATVDVTVTNTGDVAGKDVVQLYVTAPYTEGGIEKSHVQLAAFDKSSMLEPGASETVTLEVPLEEIASFDYQGEGVYVLEEGTYEFKLQGNSHDLIDVAEWQLAETVIYDEANPRPSDEVAATVQFEWAQGELEVLSRADNFANAEQVLAPAADRPMTAAEAEAVYVELTPVAAPDGAPTTGADNGLVLADLKGAEYGDPQWDALLDQVSVDEMRNLIAFGGYQTAAVDSIDKASTIDIDGPQGLSSFLGSSVRAGAYPTAMVIASTWNEDLAFARGQMVGFEALELGVNGWYAPGVNLHRNPFAGRNFEYYSEDGFLTGSMAAQEVAGAQGEGLYVYLKHFALNEQETYRNSRLITWVDEQTMREIYLRAFELPTKEGDLTAMMSAFNYVGPVWAGGSPELQNTVLRGEWGFQGMVITDYFGAYGYMNADQAVSTGGDLMLSTLGMFGAMPTWGDDAAGVATLRAATKNILFTVANSNALFTAAERDERLAQIGGDYNGPQGLHQIALDMGREPWELVAWGLNALIAALLLTLVGFKIRKYRRLFGGEGYAPDAEVVANPDASDDSPAKADVTV